MEEPTEPMRQNGGIDQDHPTVQAVKQAVLNHGWIIRDIDAIDLVSQTKEELARPETPPEPGQLSPKGLRVRAERIVRELVPDYIETADGDRPEIPDDLIEEIAAAISDHSTTS